MNPQIRPVADMYRFNTHCVRRALADLTADQAGHRWRQGEGSSIAFLVGHLLSSRCGLLKRFDARQDNPWADDFGSQAQPKDIQEYPSFEQLVRDWDDVAAQLDTLLAGFDDATLEAPADGFPIADQTARGALMFLAWHETYHVGQIGLMRTELDLPAIKDIAS